MYEGEYGYSTDFAEYWCNEVNESTKNLPEWLTVDMRIYGRLNFQRTILKLI